MAMGCFLTTIQAEAADGDDKLIMLRFHDNSSNNGISSYKKVSAANTTVSVDSILKTTPGMFQ